MIYDQRTVITDGKQVPAGGQRGSDQLLPDPSIIKPGPYQQAEAFQALN